MKKKKLNATRIMITSENPRNFSSIIDVRVELVTRRKLDLIWYLISTGGLDLTDRYHLRSYMCVSQNVIEVKLWFPFFLLSSYQRGIYIVNKSTRTKSSYQCWNEASFFVLCYVMLCYVNENFNISPTDDSSIWVGNINYALIS
jgi:hypothetical protein